MSDKSPLAKGSWIRGSACIGESHCVEIARIDGGVAIRNSKFPEVALTFGEGAWQTFVDALKTGEILR